MSMIGFQLQYSKQKLVVTKFDSLRDTKRSMQRVAHTLNDTCIVKCKAINVDANVEIQ